MGIYYNIRMEKARLLREDRAAYEAKYGRIGSSGGGSTSGGAGGSLGRNPALYGDKVTVTSSSGQTRELAYPTTAVVAGQQRSVEITSQGVQRVTDIPAGSAILPSGATFKVSEASPAVQGYLKSQNTNIMPTGYTTTKVAGQSSSTGLSLVTIGSKSVYMQDELAQKFMEQSKNTPIYETPGGTLTTTPTIIQPNAIMTEDTRSGFQKFVSRAAATEIGARAEYAKNLIGSSLQSYNQDLTSTPILSGLIERQAKSEVVGKIMLGNIKFGNEPKTIFTGAQELMLESSIFASKNIRKTVYERPASFAASAASAYGLGVVAGAAFSGAEGAIRITAEGLTKGMPFAGELAMSGIKGGLAGSFIGGTYKAGAEELRTKGTIGETATRTIFGALGAYEGSRLFKIESKISDARVSDSELSLIRGERSQLVGSSERISQAKMTVRNVLKFGDAELLASKRFTTYTGMADVNGVFDTRTGERLVSGTITKETFIEKGRGWQEMVGKPEVGRFTISIMDLKTTTTRPETLIIGEGGKSRWLPALKEAPTIYSAFEARTAEGMILPGVQKTYIMKSPELAGFEFSTIRARTYMFPAQKAAPGYELMTKSTIDVFKQGEMTAASPSVKDMSAKEGVFNILAKGGKVRTFETTALFRKDATITKTLDFSRIIKFGKDVVITKKGKEATYSIDLFKGKILTKEKGERSVESIFPQFSRLYPKSQPTVIIASKGIDITPKGYNSFDRLYPSSKKQPISVVKVEPQVSKGLISRSKITTATATQSIVESVIKAQIPTTRQELGTSMISIQSQGTSTSQNIHQGIAQPVVVSEALRVDMSPIQSLRVTQSLRVNQQQRYNLRTDQVLRQTTSTIQIPGGISTGYTEDITTIPPPTLFGWPSLGLPLQMYGKSKSKRVKFKPQYFASLKATAFNIRGKMPSKFELSTGLFTRPIIG
jgi:hypothetical protein